MGFYFELIQYIFSIGLVVSLAFLPFMLLFSKETHLNDNDAACEQVII